MCVYLSLPNNVTSNYIKKKICLSIQSDNLCLSLLPIYISLISDIWGCNYTFLLNALSFFCLLHVIFLSCPFQIDKIFYYFISFLHQLGNCMPFNYSFGGTLGLQVIILMSIACLFDFTKSNTNWCLCLFPGSASTLEYFY